MFNLPLPPLEFWWENSGFLVAISVFAFTLIYIWREFIKKEKRLINKKWDLESEIRKAREALDKGWLDSSGQTKLRMVITGWEKELEAIKAELAEIEDKKTKKEITKMLQKV